jgi:hypothetical protein
VSIGSGTPDYQTCSGGTVMPLIGFSLYHGPRKCSDVHLKNPCPLSIMYSLCPRPGCLSCRSLVPRYLLRFNLSLAYGLRNSLCCGIRIKTMPSRVVLERGSIVNSINVFIKNIAQISFSRPSQSSHLSIQYRGQYCRCQGIAVVSIAAVSTSLWACQHAQPPHLNIFREVLKRHGNSQSTSRMSTTSPLRPE